MGLLALPYDIRHQIYEHFFPPGQQIYIEAHGKTLRPMIPAKYRFSTGPLLTCRAINEEASDYLYNRYLFNIIGTKQCCLAAYKGFLDTVKKHAHDEVHVDAFSNGTHSSTMCISIHAGEGRTAMLKRRERGEPKAIDDLEKEVAASIQPLRRLSLISMPLVTQVAYAIAALLVLLSAWAIHSRNLLF